MIYTITVLFFSTKQIFIIINIHTKKLIKSRPVCFINTGLALNMDTIIVANILDSGIDIVATKSIGGDELYG